MFQAILGLGIQNFGLALYDNRGLVETLLDIYFDWMVVVAERICQIGFDFFMTTDDFAFKGGLLFSPDVFRELMVPRYGAHTEVLGLPPKAITITNSERGTAACPLRWLFRHGDGLVPTTRSAPLAMGSAVHSVVEDTHRWWMVNDSEYPGDGTRCVWCDSGCDLCDHTGLGPVSRHGKDWADFALSDSSGEYTQEQSHEDLDRLFRIVTGWWERWGKSPPEGFRVIAPELRMAVPILNPDGNPYRTRT